MVVFDVDAVDEAGEFGAHCWSWSGDCGWVGLGESGVVVGGWVGKVWCVGGSCR